MMGRNNHDIQIENKGSTIGEKVTSGNTNHSIPVDSSQVHMQKFERTITRTVRTEVDHEISTVETRVHDAILAAMDS